MKKLFVSLIGVFTLICLAHPAQASYLNGKKAAVSSDLFVTQTAQSQSITDHVVFVQLFVDEGLLAADIGASAPTVSEVQDSVAYSAHKTDGLIGFDNAKYMLSVAHTLPAEKPELVLLM